MKNLIIILIIWFSVYNVVNAQSLFLKMNGEIISPNAVVAEVDTFKITAEEFFYNYEFGPAFPKRVKDSKELHLKYMLYEKLLAIEGFKNELFDTEDIGTLYNDIIADLASEEFFKDSILNSIEIDTNKIKKVILEKKTELKISWLVAKDVNELQHFLKILKEESKYDSLFSSQLSDSIFADEREMTVTLYQLRKKNFQLSQIIDTLKAGHISAPIFVNEEWYLVKLENKFNNMILNQSEFTRLEKEAAEAITKSTMDSLSDSYVRKLMLINEPIIKRDAFNILRSYMGKFLLPREKYSQWDLDEKLKYALNNIGKNLNDEYSAINLVEAKNTILTVKDFVYWYRNRELYLKIKEDNLNSYSSSLENLVWRMIRDKLLELDAYQKGYFDNEWVQKQGSWWKEKISSSAFINHLQKSILIDKKEIESTENSNVDFSEDLNRKIYITIQRLKNEYPVKIYKDNLDKIFVSEENYKRAIDLYSIKKGGIIPRMPYPTIDQNWASWQ